MLVKIENIIIVDMAVETKVHSAFHHSGGASVLRVNYKE